MITFEEAVNGAFKLLGWIAGVFCTVLIVTLTTMIVLSAWEGTAGGNLGRYTRHEICSIIGQNKDLVHFHRHNEVGDVLIRHFDMTELTISWNPHGVPDPSM